MYSIFIGFKPFPNKNAYHPDTRISPDKLNHKQDCYLQKNSEAIHIQHSVFNNLFTFTIVKIKQ